MMRRIIIKTFDIEIIDKYYKVDKMIIRKEVFYFFYFNKLRLL